MALDNQQPNTIGPYQLLDVLGRGGMGVVYRARHRDSGLVVALKSLQVPRQELLAGIRREIHALSRIRHRGIVRILDEGLDKGVPWYVMELLEGTTLRRHRSGMPTNPRALPSAALQGESEPADAVPSVTEHLEPSTLRSLLTLVRRLCDPLAFLHGEGIVHRDLKPDNVLVRPDGMPVLMDFGLTARFAGPLSRETLELAAGATGTVPYMAPEQARGEPVDARADLYSLGCMLYELLTGRPPFLGETPQVLRQHFDAVPPVPSELVNGLPPRLDALVLRLLEKDPRRRLGYATDLAQELERLGAEDGDRVTDPRPRVYLYRPGLSGRRNELRVLGRQCQRLLKGRGAVVLVGGESGVGKTRLVLEAARQAAMRNVAVLAGGASVLPDPDATGTTSAIPLEPLRPVLQSIADRCLERGAQEADRVFGRRGKVLAVYEPALKALPGQESHPEPAELPSEAARLRLFNDLVETFSAFARDQPVLFLLDDLQWADTLTIGFLIYLLQSRRLERMPILMLGTYRTEEIRGNLRELIDRVGVQRLELGRLEETAVGTMVCDMLALERPPQAFVRFLTRCSEGNPFFVSEYLRTAVRESVLWRDSNGVWKVVDASDEAAADSVYESLPLPDSIIELVGRKLDSLTTGARRLAEIASILGRVLDTALLGAVAEAKTVDLMESTIELLAQRVLEDSGNGRVQFVHDKIREVAYARIEPVERRRELHLSAAKAIELRAGKDRPEALSVLGHHFERAGLASRARECYLGGARFAVARFAHAEAEQQYRAYLSLVDEPGAESVAARNELGGDLMLQGRPDDAIAQHERAIDDARRVGDRAAEASSLQALAKVQTNIARLREARLSCEKALALRRELADRQGEGTALGSLALLAQLEGRLDEASALHERALAIQREIGDRERQGFLSMNLAVVRFNQGRLDEARTLYEQTLVLSREIGDRRLEGVALHNLADLHSELGRLREALTLFQEALAIHRDIGHRRFEGVSLGAIGEIYHVQGKLDEAAPLFEQALLIHREVGHRRFEARALIDLGTWCLASGRPDVARSRLDEALDLSRRLEYREEEGIALREMAAMERRTSGDLVRAADLLRDAESIAESRGYLLQLATCQCELGHLELALGRSAALRLARARELASQIRAAPESRLGRSVACLCRAADAFDSGLPLQGGEWVEDVPVALRRAVAVPPRPRLA